MTRTEHLAAKVNEASRAMWHAQMVVDGARDPSPKAIATRDARIKDYRAASSAWAASYTADAVAA